MDDLRKSLSNLKEDLKYRLKGKNRVRGRAGANSAERGSSPASLLPQDSRVSASSHRSGISSDISQAHSRDLSPMLADEGCRDDSQRKGPDVEEKRGGQTHSRLDPEAEVTAGSGPSRAGKRARFPLSINSVLRKQEADSKCTPSSQLLCLIILSQNADTSDVPDHIPKELPDENAEPNAVASAKKSSWKSTAYATTKLLLRGVRDSADGFGPLKSVAGALYFILENYDVWVSLHVHHQNSHRYPSE